jgi:hypothetical protein
LVGDRGKITRNGKNVKNKEIILGGWSGEKEEPGKPGIGGRWSRVTSCSLAFQILPFNAILQTKISKLAWHGDNFPLQISLKISS